jgi:hypothetical protein
MLRHLRLGTSVEKGCLPFSEKKSGNATSVIIKAQGQKMTI